MQLYISTIAMLLFSIILIIGVMKISQIKSYIYRRDIIYMKRFDALEQMIKGDIRAILEILKK